MVRAVKPLEERSRMVGVLAHDHRGARPRTDTAVGAIGATVDEAEHWFCWKSSQRATAVMTSRQAPDAVSPAAASRIVCQEMTLHRLTSDNKAHPPHQAASAYLAGVDTPTSTPAIKPPRKTRNSCMLPGPGQQIIYQARGEFPTSLCSCWNFSL